MNPAEVIAAPERVPGFSTGDWIVLILYFVITMGVGLFFSRGQKDKRDYFLGGRQMSWWVVGFSILATETSALTFIGVPAYAFGVLAASQAGFTVIPGNMLFLQLIAGYVLGRIIIAIWIVPLYFKGDVYTPFQLLSRAFGWQARMTGGALSLVGLILGAGVRILVSAIPVTVMMQIVTPQWNLLMSIFCILVIALVYTAFGGIKAVVWTDMLQYFFYLAGGIFALLYIPTLLTPDGSWASGWQAAKDIAGPDRFQWFNSGLVDSQTAATVIGPDAGILAFLGLQIRNIFTGPFNIIMGLVPQTIGIILAFGFDQLNVQRVLGCKNIREGRKAILLSAVLILPQFWLFLYIGISLFAFYSNNGFQFPIFPGDPATVAAGKPSPSADYVFPIFIITEMPNLLRGFLISAILAAAMSSVSSALSAMSSILVMDFINPLSRRERTPRQELVLSIGITVVSGVVLGIVAWACREAPFLLTLAFKLAGLVGGGILGAFVFGMWKKRGHNGPVVAGMIISFLFMILYNWIRSNTDFKINWPWDATIGMLVCLLVATLASIGLPPVEGAGIDSEAADGK